MADNGRKTFVEPGLAALRRFLTTLPETAKEWPRQAFDMVRMPADLVLGGSPEEKAIEEARQRQGYVDLMRGRVHSSPELSNLPTSHGAANYRPGTPEARAHQVSEFINPIANSVFAPVKAARGVKQGALALMDRALMPPKAIAQAGAIKPRGGNWLTEGEGSVTDFVRGNRMSIADDGERFAQVFGGNLPPDAIQRQLLAARAANGWMDGPLTNYLKKDFAADTDPVRLLADQGITHGNVEQMLPDNVSIPNLKHYANDARREADAIQPKSMASFVPRQMAKSEAGKQWENLADTTAIPVAKQQLRIGERLANPWTDRLGDNDLVHAMVPSEQGDLGVSNIVQHFMDAMEEGTLNPEALKQMSMEKAVRFVHGRNQAKEAALVAEMMETGRSPVYMGTRLKEGADGSYLTELALPKELTDDMRKLVRQNEDGTWSALTPSGKVMQRRIRPGEESPLVDVVEDTPEKALLGGMLGHEGRTMKHCVGGYCDEVAGGNTRVISMRGPDGQSHVTMDIQQGINEDALLEDAMEYAMEEVQQLRPGDPRHARLYNQAMDRFMEARRAEVSKPMISQVYGQANSKPKDEYLPMIQDFIKSSGYNVEDDALKNAQLRKINDKYYSQGDIDAILKDTAHPERKWVDDYFANEGVKGYAAGGLITAGDDDDFSYPGHF